MNLLEHYIEEVLEIEDVTNKYLKIFSGINEPIYKIKMVINCYGNKEEIENIWHKSEYEYNIKKGYYLA